MLIVDDASPDGTGQIADAYAAANRARVQVLHRTGKRGLGLSYIDGMRRRAANRCHAHLPDGRRPLAQSGRCSATARTRPNRADFVIGSRYVAGGRIENWPLHRRMLSAFANRYIRADHAAGDRATARAASAAGRREALERLPLASIRSDGYAFIVELAWEASRAGLRCAEVPITFVERREGASKLSSGVIVESAIVPWRLAARPEIDLK